MSGICSDYYTDYKEFSTYKKCVVHGLEQSTKIIKQFDDDIMNNELTIIKFMCIEQDSKKV
jgi:orotate phosphoribosyltransferase